MIRRFALLFVLLPYLLHAQGSVTFTSNNLRMGGGAAALATGSQLCVMTVDSNNRPAGYRVGDAGQTVAALGQRECHAITDGAVQPFQAINSDKSSPRFACIRVTLEAASGAVLRTDPCVQTGTAEAIASGFCTSSGGVITCNYDAYAVGTAPVALVQVGPPGPAGPAGSNVPLTDATLRANTGAVLSSVSTPQAIPSATVGALNGIHAGAYANTVRPGLRDFLTRLHGAASSDGALVGVLVDGDSQSRLCSIIGATGPADCDNRWPDQVAKELGGKYGGVNGIAVPVLWGAGTANANSPNPQHWSISGGFSTERTLGPYQDGDAPFSSVVVLQTGAVATFTTNRIYDAFAVYCQTDATSRGLTVRVDGTVQGNFSAVSGRSTACGTNQSSAMAIREFAGANVPRTTHTMTLTCVTGPCKLYKVEVTDGLRGIVLHNSAVGACKSDCYAGASKYAFDDLIPNLRLAINMLGTNDVLQSGSTPAGFTANMIAIDQHFLGRGVSVFSIIPPYTAIGGNQGNWATYTAAAVSAAATAGVPYVNVQDRWGSATILTHALAGDQLHPNDEGSRDIAAMVLAALVEDHLPSASQNLDQLNVGKAPAGQAFGVHTGKNGNVWTRNYGDFVTGGIAAMLQAVIDDGTAETPMVLEGSQIWINPLTQGPVCIGSASCATLPTPFGNPVFLGVGTAANQFLVDSVGNALANTLTLKSVATDLCNAASRGAFNYIAGAGGAKDTVQVCAKDALDAYAWRPIY